MKKTLILLLITSLSINPAFSEPKIIKIKAGEVAQFDGYIINDDMESEMRQINEEKKHLERVVISLKDLQVNQEQTIAILKTRLDTSYQVVDRLEKKVEAREKEGFFAKTLHFLGGAVLTGGIAVGVSRGLK